MKSLFFLLLFVVCIGKINAMRFLLRGLREDGLGGGKWGGCSHRARLVDKGPGYINVIHRLNSDSIQSNIKFKD